MFEFQVLKVSLESYKEEKHLLVVQLSETRKSLETESAENQSRIAELEAELDRLRELQQQWDARDAKKLELDLEREKGRLAGDFFPFAMVVTEQYIIIRKPVYVHVLLCTAINFFCTPMYMNNTA